MKHEFRMAGKDEEAYQSLLSMSKFRSESSFIRFLIKSGMQGFLDRVAIEYFQYELTKPFEDEKGNTINPMFALIDRPTKILVRIRDQNRCRKCGTDKNVEIHHIDRNKENNAIENLILLCHSCNKKAHRFIRKKDCEKLFAIWFYFAEQHVSMPLDKINEKIKEITKDL